MKAIRIVAIGEPLVEAEIDTPVPKAGEVLVAVRAAGICHSDAHYRSGVGSLARLPMTPGHEVAGVIESVGEGVGPDRIGDRVCLHYLVTCGKCDYCRRNIGQFCPRAAMIGKDRDGGYAEYLCVPEHNAFTLPDELGYAQAAVMMCSYATVLHALRRARFAEGDSVAIFGTGGLGVAAIGIAGALGASRVIAVDTNSAKLEMARSLGATGIDACDADVVDSIMGATAGRGVDIALELVGLPVTSEQAVRSLGVHGRAAMVGLSDAATSLNMYRDLIGKERDIVGVSDHLSADIDELLALVRHGRLDVDPVISETIPLHGDAVNTVLDRLDDYGGSAIRTVINVDEDSTQLGHGDK